MRLSCAFSRGFSGPAGSRDHLRPLFRGLRALGSLSSKAGSPKIRGLIRGLGFRGLGLRFRVFCFKVLQGFRV